MTDVDPTADGSGQSSGDGRRLGRSKAATKQKKKKKSLPLWQETLLLLGLALVLALIIKSLFVQAFYIPSPSMEPQFIENDRILVQKVSYWSGSPERGDIVVFRDPGDWLATVPTAETGVVTDVLERIGLYPSGGHLVKRVLAVGGDRIVCCDRDRLTVNGTPLEESDYLPAGTAPSMEEFDVRVPDGHLWMMGDNRGNSFDSRGHMGEPGGGFVDEDLVVGKVFALIWPAGRAEIVHRPDAFEDLPAPR